MRYVADCFIAAVAALHLLATPLQAADGIGGESVLERFRHYAGQRNPGQLTALFSRPMDEPVRQSPAIAMSDGKTAVIIAARITPVAEAATNFSLEGATITSVKKIKADEWRITALPEKGTVTMALHVLRGERLTIHPLVAAPALPPGTDLTPRGFEEFLENGSGKGEKQRDLNGDGRRDYLDDYIYTANYLARQGTTRPDRSSRKERALQRSLTVVPAPPKIEFNPDDFPE